MNHVTDLELALLLAEAELKGFNKAYDIIKANLQVEA